MKRRGILACFAMLLVLILAIGAAAYDFAPDSSAVVFVSDSGADTNSGASAETAVGTLGRAYELLANSKGGTIVVCGAVTVSDTGVGFDVERYMDDGKVHVGLMNVRQRLASRMNATVDIDSTPGKGTTVTVTIPREKVNP